MKKKSLSTKPFFSEMDKPNHTFDFIWILLFLIDNEQRIPYKLLLSFA